MTRPVVTLLLLSAVGLGACAGRAGPGTAVAPEHLHGPADGSIQPGDKLKLRIFEEPAMSDEFTVDQEGRVVLPKVGTVDVSGIQVPTAADSLRTLLSAYLRNPSMEVTVLRRVGVHGEVRNPGLYWVDLTMSLRDAVALAGGVTEEGSPGHLLIVRGDQATELAGYERWALLDVGIASGDQVVVPRRSWTSLNMPFIVSTLISMLSIGAILIARP